MSCSLIDGKLAHLLIAMRLLVQALVEFCVVLEGVQNDMCVHISYIPEIKKKSGGSGWMDGMLRVGMICHMGLYLSG